VGLFDRTLTGLLPAVPRPLVRRLASPYIAGAELDDAVAVVRRLNGQGKLATVDVLGEEVGSPAEAAEIASQYHAALARIDAERLQANVSIKLTGFGLELDPELCLGHVAELLEDAERRGSFVRIDMEDSSTTDATLALYRELRARGHDNLGVVLQARLRRTLADVPGLANVRLCKGIYLEPAEIAYLDREEIRASFLSTLDALFDGGSYVAIATHDELLIGEALARIARLRLTPERYEFQMLLGVRAERAAELVAAGHRLRIYVPFGRRWYESSVRRLQENPRIAGYVAADLVRRLSPTR
jgi:proline dehydrogenase